MEDWSNLGADTRECAAPGELQLFSLVLYKKFFQVILEWGQVACQHLTVFRLVLGPFLSSKPVHFVELNENFDRTKYYGMFFGYRPMIQYPFGIHFSWDKRIKIDLIQCPWVWKDIDRHLTNMIFDIMKVLKELYKVDSLDNQKVPTRATSHLLLEKFCEIGPNEFFDGRKF